MPSRPKHNYTCVRFSFPVPVTRFICTLVQYTDNTVLRRSVYVTRCTTAETQILLALLSGQRETHRPFPTYRKVNYCRKGRKGIALLILNLCARWLVVNAKLRPLYPSETATRPIVQKAGSAPGPVWTDMEKRKSLGPTGVRAPHSPAHSESLYRLSYPGLPPYIYTPIKIHAWNNVIFNYFQRPRGKILRSPAKDYDQDLTQHPAKITFSVITT
jgi:hypothetical protein